VTFKDPDHQELKTIGDAKKRILTLFRKILPLLKKDCMDSIGQVAETGRVVSGLSDSAGKEGKGRGR
jgi:hypothetical protein